MSCLKTFLLQTFCPVANCVLLRKGVSDPHCSARIYANRVCVYCRPAVVSEYRDSNIHVTKLKEFERLTFGRTEGFGRRCSSSPREGR
jgi:hypothetical protein